MKRKRQPRKQSLRPRLNKQSASSKQASRSVVCPSVTDRPTGRALSRVRAEGACCMLPTDHRHFPALLLSSSLLLSSRHAHILQFPTMGLAKTLEPFVCGGSAATFASVAIHPIDLAKVRVGFQCLSSCAVQLRELQLHY